MSNVISAVRRGYDRWASVYDSDANPLQALEGPVVRRTLGDPQGLEVLDLGCGTGRHALWLAARGARVTAIDFSEGMLAEARSKECAEQVRWICHDVHTPLPLGDGEFDLVVSGLVLEHLQELFQFFGEVARLLKPKTAATGSGRAVISAMHPAMFLRGSQARFTDPATGELVQPGSIAHSISDFVMAAIGAKLRVKSIEEFSPDAGFAARYPRAQKYIGWPMLVVMELEMEERGNAAARETSAEQ